MKNKGKIIAVVGTLALGIGLYYYINKYGLGTVIPPSA